MAPTVAKQWLGWTAAGLEGLCFKRLDEPYRPVRSWKEYKVRVTTEAIVGAVSGRCPRRRISAVMLSTWHVGGCSWVKRRSRPMHPVARRDLGHRGRLLAEI